MNSYSSRLVIISVLSFGLCQMIRPITFTGFLCSRGDTCYWGCAATTKIKIRSKKTKTDIIKSIIYQNWKAIPSLVSLISLVSIFHADILWRENGIIQLTVLGPVNQVNPGHVKKVGGSQMVPHLKIDHKCKP